jgi:hypothetical protein
MRMEYFANIAYTKVLGLPVVGWGGIATLTLFLVTAVVGVLTLRGILRIPVKVHVVLAALAVLMALSHGLLGILANV